MKLLIGLGNPGGKYRYTRHNVGFKVLDQLAEKLSLKWRLSKHHNCQVARSDEVILAKPMTYVNKSGEAVLSVSRERKYDIDEIIVIHDDADLMVGRYKIKKGGSSAGHKGIESIDQAIGKEYWRVRIGIGRDHNTDLSEYVLEKFQEGERILLDSVIDQLVSLLLKYLEGHKDIQSLINNSPRKR